MRICPWSLVEWIDGSSCPCRCPIQRLHLLVFGEMPAAVSGRGTSDCVVVPLLNAPTLTRLVKSTCSASSWPAHCMTERAQDIPSLSSEADFSHVFIKADVVLLEPPPYPKSYKNAHVQANNALLVPASENALHCLIVPLQQLLLRCFFASGFR